MKIFVGRDRELSLLKNFFDSTADKAACVYGRLGIGKTALVKEALQGLKYVYVTVSSTTDWGLVSDFAGQIMGTSADLAADTTLQALAGRHMHAAAEYTDLFAEEMELIRDCRKAFAYLLTRIEVLSAQKGLTLVIDGYPELVKAGNFADLLVDRITKQDREHPVKLIMMADSYNQAEKYVFSAKSAWGKIPVKRIEVKALSFYSSKIFLGQVSARDAVLYYGLTGGIPYYLNRLYGHTASHADAIRAVFYDAEESHSLNSETILSQDLREFSYYTRLLTLLAAGNMRVNRLADVFEKPKDIVVPYLTTLIGLGMVEKENSVTEKTNRRKTRYQIVNSYDLFYYKYMAVNRNLVSAGGWEELTARIEADIADYLHEVMIGVCKEYLMLQSAKGAFPFELAEVGNWWENDEEAGTSNDFDLVALGKEGTNAFVFGRCYCGDKPVAISMLKGMLELTKKVPGGENLLYMMFSANGFHENVVTAADAISNIKLIRLDDVTEL